MGKRATQKETTKKNTSQSRLAQLFSNLPTQHESEQANTASLQEKPAAEQITFRSRFTNS